MSNISIDQIPSFLSSENLSNLFSNFNAPWATPESYGTAESGGSFLMNPQVNQDATNWLEDQGLSFDYQGVLGNGTLTSRNSKGEVVNSYTESPDNSFLGSLALGLSLGPLAPGLNGLFGGGFTGAALAGGTLGGVSSAAQGGDFGKGFLTGAVGGGLGNFNPAESLGITDSAFSGPVNSAIGSTAANLASGKSLENSLKSGAIAGISNGVKTGMNDFFGNLFKNFSSPQSGDFSDITGANAFDSYSTMNQANPLITQTNGFEVGDGLPALSSNPVMNASYGPGMYKPPGVGILQEAGLGPEMSYAPPNSPVQSDVTTSLFNSVDSGAPQQKPLSLSLPSLGQLGSFASNNAGTLAQMLYGLYNNRKQQNMLKGAMGGLQGLFAQGSPYAKQLQAQLAAKAAQQGKRSNVGARETQLQAALADKAASTMPQLFQMMQGQNALKNNQMDILLGGARNLKGLGGLFGLGG